MLSIGCERKMGPPGKFPRWRVKGKTIKEVAEAYRSVGAELNVLPFCTQFIPMGGVTQSMVPLFITPSIPSQAQRSFTINW